MTPTVLPTPLTGRDTNCEACGTLIRVHGHLPERFVCGECLRPVPERVPFNTFPAGYGVREAERRYESWVETLKDHGP